jgi:ABC-2 type transport system permease protein
MATSVETHLPTDAGAATSSELRRGTLRRHANLTRELAISQFKLKYTGSVLGYVWSLVKPLMMFAILYVVFAKLFHLDKGTDNYIFQLLLGIVLWTFFQETTQAAMNSIASNGNMIRKAYFPRVILVVAATLSSLMTFVINLVLIIIIAGTLGKLALGWHSVLLPLFLIELYLLVLGISMLLSSLFVFYRDLGHIWDIATQLLIYASAVIFPIVPTVPERLRAWVLANPVAQIVEDVRRTLVSSKIGWTYDFMHATYIVPFAIVGILLALGFYVFNRLTPRFAEYL